MPHLIITGIVAPEKPDMTIDAGGSPKDGDVTPSRPKTVRGSPRHSLADRYPGPARQTARNPSAVPE